jgi:hypothetical protein
MSQSDTFLYPPNIPASRKIDMEFVLEYRLAEVGSGLKEVYLYQTLTMSQQGIEAAITRTTDIDSIRMNPANTEAAFSAANNSAVFTASGTEANITVKPGMVNCTSMSKCRRRLLSQSDTEESADEVSYTTLTSTAKFSKRGRGESCGVEAGAGQESSDEREKSGEITTRKILSVPHVLFKDLKQDL